MASQVFKYVLCYHDSKYLVTVQRNFLTDCGRKPPQMNFPSTADISCSIRQLVLVKGKISGKQVTEGKVVEVWVCSLLKKLPA